MKQPNKQAAHSRVTAVLRDGQFWIPFSILILGLIILKMVE